VHGFRKARPNGLFIFARPPLRGRSTLSGIFTPPHRVRFWAELAAGYGCVAGDQIVKAAWNSWEQVPVTCAPGCLRHPAVVCR
jgi:hypothetical protein